MNEDHRCADRFIPAAPSVNLYHLKLINPLLRDKRGREGLGFIDLNEEPNGR
jgi:hypothetical protein